MMMGCNPIRFVRYMRDGFFIQKIKIKINKIMSNKEKRNVTIIRPKKGEKQTMYAEKPNRNAKCKCGSGRKAKNCCGVETKYYTRK